jgi:hypothetical protein
VFLQVTGECIDFISAKDEIASAQVRPEYFASEVYQITIRHHVIMEERNA